MLSKGFLIKIVTISAALAMCIAGLWITYDQGYPENPNVVEASESVPVPVVKTEPVEEDDADYIKPTFEPIRPVAVTIGEADNDQAQKTNGIGVLSESDGVVESAGAGIDDVYTEEFQESEEDYEVFEQEQADEYQTYEEEHVDYYESGDDGEVYEESAEPNMEYLGDWTISFYCNCELCTGIWAGGATASGVMPEAWYTCATDGLEFGTVLYVDGLGYFEVQDRGTSYGWLDIYVSEHQEALNLGLQNRSVYVVR